MTLAETRDPIFTARQMGRYATRVRVIAGAFGGMTGVIVQIYHPGSVEIRFTSGPYEGRALQFGPSELEVLA